MGAFRFQYITLATFLVNGLCSDKETEPRRIEYGQLYYVSDWDEFYKGSSDGLTTAHSAEICLCTRDEFEFRSFTYQDQQVSFGFLYITTCARTLASQPGRACRGEG